MTLGMKYLAGHVEGDRAAVGRQRVRVASALVLEAPDVAQLEERAGVVALAALGRLLPRLLEPGEHPEGVEMLRSRSIECCASD